MLSVSLWIANPLWFSQAPNAVNSLFLCHWSVMPCFDPTASAGAFALSRSEIVNESLYPVVGSLTVHRVPEHDADSRNVGSAEWLVSP